MTVIFKFFSYLLGASIQIPFRFHRIKTILKLHWSLLLLFGAYLYYLSDVDWSHQWVKIIGLCLLMILSIFIHELGHAFTFVYGFDIEVQHIMLMCLGGATIPSQEPTKKGAEAIVALVGPMMNFILGGILAFLYLAIEDESTRVFVFLLMISNVALAVFNLIPIYPLDGGRAFRSIMNICCSPMISISIAAVIAIPGGIGVIIFGIYIEDVLSVITGLLIILVVILEWWRVRKNIPLNEVHQEQQIELLTEIPDESI